MCFILSGVLISFAIHSGIDIVLIDCRVRNRISLLLAYWPSQERVLYLLSVRSIVYHSKGKDTELLSGKQH